MIEYCPRCKGEVDMSEYNPECMNCHTVWASYTAYRSEVRTVKASVLAGAPAYDLKKGYIDSKFVADLERLVLLAQRSFVDELISTLETTVKEFKDWLDNTAAGVETPLEIAKMEGAHNALKEMLDGFKSALSEEVADDDA